MVKVSANLINRAKSLNVLLDPFRNAIPVSFSTPDGTAQTPVMIYSRRLQKWVVAPPLTEGKIAVRSHLFPRHTKAANGDWQLDESLDKFMQNVVPKNGQKGTK